MCNIFFCVQGRVFCDTKICNCVNSNLLDPWINHEQGCGVEEYDHFRDEDTAIKMASSLNKLSEILCTEDNLARIVFVDLLRKQLFKKRK